MPFLAASWKEPDSLPRLDSHETHVWRVDTRPLVSALAPYATLLSADEIARRDRLHAGPLQDRFVLVRGSLRRLLGHYLGLLPGQVRLVTNAYGKPGVDPPVLHFNVSYAGHLALLAFSRHGRVGVDAELIRPMAEMEAVIAGWFSSDEHAVWQALPPVERLRAFYRAWTRKEAFIKALGLGLSFPLARFSVTFAPGIPPRILNVEEQTDHPWLLLDVSPDDQTAAALVIEAPQGEITCWRWTP